MSKIVVCSVRDRAIQAFGRPFFVPHVNGALRDFRTAINGPKDGNTNLTQHPEDFELYELGLFDEDTGQFELLKAPRLVAVGKDLINS